MHDDSEAIQASFLKLLQDFNLTDVPTSEQFVPDLVLENEYEGIPALSDLDFLDAEEVDVTLPGQSEMQKLSFLGEEPLKPGEVPAVQDRFHALLKRRLQVEIQRNPPLFPWETSITDYETETPGVVYAASNAASPQAEPAVAETPAPASRPRILTPVWAAQLQNLNLPVPMPEAILAHLLERCQEAVQTSLREGAKLVQAVESLFPGHNQSLNQLAGLVLVSPARSGSQTRLPVSTANFPSNYEAAVPAQQMVLSLLAAREIINSLTLTLSPTQPTAERQWLTDAGLIKLQTAYDVQPHSSRLHVQGELPLGGRLNFRAGDAQATAQRSDAGWLSVELFDLTPDQTYPLDVEFNEPGSNPLTFAVHLGRE
jgi:hypothetical protein